ncbi:MAG: hypothetical protein MUF58_14300 [Arcicella sp.]|nr:hypothetical protein [Arcicella sp.]
MLNNNLILRYNIYNSYLSNFNISTQNFQNLNSNLYTFKESILLNNVLLFNGFDGNTNDSRELWRTDGTVEGTYMVKDINIGTGNSDSKNYKILNNICYFSATSSNGRELWRTDGTANGTYEVKNINAGSASSDPFGFEELNGILYFFAKNSINGGELWRSDGTESGTYIVKDICAGSCSSMESTWERLGGKYVFTKIGNNLLFYAYTDQYGLELWKTDGTPQGTILLKDINNGSSTSYNFSNEPAQIEHNGILYFAALDGINGIELWRSDGTVEGTYLLKDINTNNSDPNPVNRDSFPTYFNVFNGKIYFIAFHPTFGREIWYTDGTNAGTQMLMNINSSTSNERFSSSGPVSNCKGFFIKNDRFYFTMDNGINGREMWSSNGTLSGTSMLFELNLGSASSFNTYIDYTDIVTFENKLYFFANDGIIGTALWSYDLCSNNLLLISPNDDFTNTTAIKKASISISANNQINNSNVIYSAGSKIELNNGFNIQSGSVFKAQISGCN